MTRKKKMDPDLASAPEEETGSPEPPEGNDEDIEAFEGAETPGEEEAARKKELLEGVLEQVRGELDHLKDQHLRLAADFENYRKRVSAELSESWARAQAELSRSLLDGLDDLQRVSAFQGEETTLEALMEGVDLVERKLFRALSEAGLEAFGAEGEPFDPNVMEAMMRVQATEDGKDDTVHQLFQKGYRFRDHLVRPARVSVYKDDD